VAIPQANKLAYFTNRVLSPVDAHVPAIWAAAHGITTSITTSSPHRAIAIANTHVHTHPTVRTLARVTAGVTQRTAVKWLVMCVAGCVPEWFKPTVFTFNAHLDFLIFLIKRHDLISQTDRVCVGARL
jgi:hypothetical protein